MNEEEMRREEEERYQMAEWDESQRARIKSEALDVQLLNAFHKHNRRYFNSLMAKVLAAIESGERDLYSESQLAKISGEEEVRDLVNTAIETHDFLKEVLK